MIADIHPYPAYKPSGVQWLGNIPEHWEVRRLKYAATIIAGQSPPSGNGAKWHTLSVFAAMAGRSGRASVVSIGEPTADRGKGEDDQTG